MNLQDLTFSVPNNDGTTLITVNAGEFAGIQYQYGRVWFEDENEPVMSYEYDVLSEQKIPTEKKQQFDIEAGEILKEILVASLANEDVAYVGGTGEVPKVIEKAKDKSRILLPADYRVPEPEVGTRMSRNLMEGL